MAAGGSGNQQRGGYDLGKSYSGGLGGGHSGNSGPGGKIAPLWTQEGYAKLLAQRQGGGMKPAAPAAPTPPWLMKSTVPAATLGGPIPGLQDYMVNMPSYGYFGQPGQVRPPQSAMLSGVQPPAPAQAMGQRQAPNDWRRALMLGGF
jgi:hypothetical protein